MCGLPLIVVLILTSTLSFGTHSRDRLVDWSYSSVFVELRTRKTSKPFGFENDFENDSLVSGLFTVRRNLSVHTCQSLRLVYFHQDRRTSERGMSKQFRCGCHISSQSNYILEGHSESAVGERLGPPGRSLCQISSTSTWILNFAIILAKLRKLLEFANVCNVLLKLNQNH